MVALVNSRISGAITLLITIFSLSLPADAQYSGGTGEPNDPYQIATAEDLMLLGENPEDYDKHFILTDDIDLDPNLPDRKVFDSAVIAPDIDRSNWSFDGIPFSGIFDGNWYTIRNLVIDDSALNNDFLGLFGYNSGEVINIGLSNVYIRGSEDSHRIGGLIGRNVGTVSNCYATGKVCGGEHVGGLVGNNSNSISSCYTAVDVNGLDDIGGLVGDNEHSSILNCYATGSVNSGIHTGGGLVGDNEDGSVSNCYSTGAVSKGIGSVGGLIGYTPSGSVSNSFWDTQTSGMNTSDGGTGKTTEDMQTAGTFLDAGWDFVGETENGTDNIWKIVEGLDYPRLWWEKYSGGTGEPNDPYQIATAANLIALGETPEDYDKHFILTNNIDLDPNLPGRKIFDMSVIAPDRDKINDHFQGIPFAGVFDGNSHVIINLKVIGRDYLGLFGYLSHTACILNVGVESVEINGKEYVAGLVGSNASCVTASYSIGSVSGRYSVGGLVGGNSGSVTASYSTGSVNGVVIGGVGGPWNVGGLVGINYGSIATSHNYSSVSGSSSVGGLVGRNVGGNIYSSSSNGSVSGKDNVGGLVGDNEGSVSMSYSSGSVSGSDSVGGLVGDNVLGKIVSSCSSGLVIGDDDVGGLVGRNKSRVSSTGSVNSSFWDVQNSGQTTSAGGIAKTTNEMQNIQSFLSIGWDFNNEIANGTCDYWQITPGDYPKLRYIGDTHPLMPEGLGTAEHPYLIRDARDLGTVWFKPLAHYSLLQSVDLSGITWHTAVIPWFGGTFDGSGYIVFNLNIQGDDYLGFFGQLNSFANISNIGLEEVEVVGIGDTVGSLVGLSEGNIVASFSNGLVSGNDDVGGLVGRSNGGRIESSHSKGSVFGVSTVGGLVGGHSGNITKSYSNSSVSGIRDIGGLVGINWGRIVSSYSSGAVSGNLDVGGFVGWNSGIINSSFWDRQTSGHSWGGWGVWGTGKTTAQMQTAVTFIEAGWDFVGEAENGTENIWWIDEGNDYPRLWWEIGDEASP